MHSTHFPLSCSECNLLFMGTTVHSSAQASVKQNVPMYPDWEFARFESNRSIRALSTEVTVPGGLKNASVENCIGECKSLKFDVQQMAISNCHTPCTGDSNEYCGGNGALLIYFIPKSG
ncbi:hypothetical protein EI94DRAFT_1748688 [Lactarius quietus]|nr:hypothetical protein EI94DRAFT_1748688 [Lactarius quietus]